MQQYTPRPSLQSTQRPSGTMSMPFNRQSGVQVPQRSQNMGPADHVVARGYEPPHINPTSYGHYAASGEQSQHTPTYASSTQALFAATNETPYQQMYHLDPVKQQRRHHFPFRALMIVLVLGAMSFGAYAVYRAFTNPAPANAELPYNAHNDPELAP